MDINDLRGDADEIAPDLAFALETLLRVVERQSGEFKGSILLLAADGNRLLDGAAPSLPSKYRAAIHGLRIGPDVGSCGTAAFRGKRVIVTDIATDPLWADFRELALPLGLAACWSEPIRGSAGDLLGTFAMYYPEPRVPTSDDLHLIEAAAARAAILLEKAYSGGTREELVAGLA